MAIINAIFITGWYISAVLFFLQAYKLYRSKDANGASWLASLGFFILNVNSTLWMYFHGQYLTIIATAGIALASLLNLLLIVKYGSRTRKYDAVIFDLDGTLFDTQNSVHAMAECQVLAECGIMVSPESISHRFAGIPTEKVFQEMALDHNPQELLEKKWQIVKELLQSSNPEPIAGMHKLLEHLASCNIPVIMASASPGWYIHSMLKKNMARPDAKGMGIWHAPLGRYFERNFVSAEEVLYPKPAPDVFLEAARRLGVRPEKCLVIGDGKSDLRGGLAAGMDVLFLGHTDDEVEKSPRALAFSQSEELAAYLIKQLPV